VKPGLLLLALLAVSSTACAPAIGSESRPASRSTAERGAAAQTRVMVPAGYGTLRQDDATVSLRSGPVMVKITPLDEALIRLLAPDTYTRLHALRESRSAEADRASMRPVELFLVSFFSYQPDVLFQPEDLQLFHQSRVLRPSLIMPVTSGWGQQRLAQQETQTAIYAYESPIEYDQAITVRYGQVESDEWRQVLMRLETERSKVLSRVR
jgi:hypothetical protein